MTDALALPRNKRIEPGATLGVLGSGQLGRMFAKAAARLGYRVHIFAPVADGLGGKSPAGQVAAEETIAAYHDLDALARFAKSVDLVTLEFENIPAEMVDHLERYTCVRPGPNVLHISQHRLREK